MSFIDWGIPGQYAATDAQTQANANTQLQQVQTARALNALRGTNIGDQTSVQNGINALTGLGMFDQAKALTDLAQQRTINQTTAPLIQETGSLYKQGLDQAAARAAQQQQASSSSDQLSPDQLQQAQNTMQAAGQALARVKAAPPDQRGAVLDQELQQFQVAGLDPRALAAVKNHLTDANFADESIDQLTDHYASHAENFGGMAQGNPVADNLSRHPADMYGPGTDLAAGYLNDPLLMDPRLRGFGAKYLGIDVGGGIDTAANLTANQRQVAAAGPQAYRSTAGTRVAEGQYPALQQGEQYLYDSAGNVSAIKMASGVVQNITARQQATEAGTPQHVPLPQGGEAVATPTFDGQGRATFNTGQVAGAPGGTQPAASPSIAHAAGIGGEAAAATAAATQSQNSAGGFPTRMRDYENLRTAAAQIPTGPHASFWGFLGALKQEYAPNLPIQIGPNATNQANYEEVRKLAQRVLAYQTDTLGLPKTNQSVDLASGATPHEETSPAGIQRLVGMLEGNETYLNARNTAFNEYQRLNPGKGPETWNDFIPIWNANMDPGIFQAHFMTPAEADTIRQRMGPARFDAMKNAARRLGYFAGF